MRSSRTSEDQISTATPANSPYVPLAVYQKLAVKLQAAEEMVDFLNAQNKHLVKQNQQLQQEIAQAVQSVLRLQQVADLTAVNRTYVYHPRQSFRSPTAGKSHIADISPLPIQSAKAMFSEKVFTATESGRYRRRSQPETAVQASGWGLAIAILLIVLTAFGAGYLIIRPLLPSR